MKVSSTIRLAALTIATAVVLSAAEAIAQDATNMTLSKPAVVKTARRVFGQVSLDVSGSIQLGVGNRSTGKITVTGWDRDVIAAHAFSERGEEVLIVDQKAVGPLSKIFLKADYADTPSANPSVRLLESPPTSNDGPLRINLEINLPRRAEIEVIRVMRSDVTITGVETPITILGEKGKVVLRDVGAVEVHTKSGEVEVENATGAVEVTTASAAVKIENASGLVQATTSSGAINVAQAQAGVRAVSIAGAIGLKCIRGRIDATSTNAAIEIEQSEGDVDAASISSTVRFAGELRDDANYHLKSLSGTVEMILPANTRGFDATLTSYRGRVESDFQLNRPLRRPLRQVTNRDGEKEITRRLSGHFGVRRSQIWLDSFEGLARLTKITRPQLTPCK